MLYTIDRMPHVIPFINPIVSCSFIKLIMAVRIWDGGGACVRVYHDTEVSGPVSCSIRKQGSVFQQLGQEFSSSGGTLLVSIEVTLLVDVQQGIRLRLITCRKRPPPPHQSNNIDQWFETSYTEYRLQK